MAQAKVTVTTEATSLFGTRRPSRAGQRAGLRAWGAATGHLGQDETQGVGTGAGGSVDSAWRDRKKELCGVSPVSSVKRGARSRVETARQGAWAA